MDGASATASIRDEQAKRSAELEEIRRKQLATTHRAHREVDAVADARIEGAPSKRTAVPAAEAAAAAIRESASGAAAPTSLDAWHMQQRAQTEEIRKKRTDAEKLLRGYRGNAVDVAMHSSAKHRARDVSSADAATVASDAVRAGEKGEAQQQAASVSVSTMTAALEGKSTTGRFEKHRGGDGAGSDHALNHSTQEETVSSLEKKNDEWVMIDDIAQPQTDGVGAKGGEISGECALTEASASVAHLEAHDEMNPLSRDTSNRPSQSSDDWTDELTNASNPMESSAESFSLVHSGTSAAALLRVDVRFSFGIITRRPDAPTNAAQGHLGESMILKQYMSAAEVVVQARLPVKGAAFGGVYDPSFPPYVVSVENDANFIPPNSRPDVVRSIVHAMLPIFVRGDSAGTTDDIRRAILADLRVAVSDGSFKTLALSGQAPVGAA